MAISENEYLRLRYKVPTKTTDSIYVDWPFGGIFVNSRHLKSRAIPTSQWQSQLALIESFICNFQLSARQQLKCPLKCPLSIFLDNGFIDSRYGSQTASIILIRLPSGWVCPRYLKRGSAAAKRATQSSSSRSLALRSKSIMRSIPLYYLYYQREIKEFQPHSPGNLLIPRIRIISGTRLR